MICSLLWQENLPRRWWVPTEERASCRAQDEIYVRKYSEMVSGFEDSERVLGLPGQGIQS